MDWRWRGFARGLTGSLIIGSIAALPPLLVQNSIFQADAVRQGSIQSSVVTGQTPIHGLATGLHPPLSQAAYCYAPGTPEKDIQAHPPFPGSADFHPQFNTTNRWSGGLGTPRMLRWSLIPDGVTVNGETNELFNRMDSLFAGQGGRATWVALFQTCFDRWAALTGLSYTRITYAGNDWDDGASFGASGSSTRGDIRIAMIVQDGASGVLAYNYYPSHGDMVLDRDENWGASSNNFRFMRNILLHEHGHGIGLRHVCPSNRTKLMEPFLATGFDGPQHDDVRGGQFLYGDGHALNDSPATATLLGAIAVNAPLTFGAVPAPTVSNTSLLSIEADGRSDYYLFSVSAPQGIQATLIPLGLTYDSSVQNPDNSCSSGNHINSLTMADLGFDVIAANGSTVLANVNLAPAGGTESAPVSLPAAGAYFLRVWENGSPAQPQMYRIELSINDCNGNGQSDVLDITSGLSSDCDGSGLPDECEINPSNDTNTNQILDVCERRRGDFDLDADVDMSDFAHLQACLMSGTQSNPACHDARLDGNLTVDAADMSIFLGCLAGPEVSYDPACN